MKISCAYTLFPKWISLLFSANNSQFVFKMKLVCIIIISALGIVSPPVCAQETLVGLTSTGGSQGKGTAFSIQTNGTAFTIINAFNDWGRNPLGALTKGNDGNYYGMTSEGGTYNNGTIFRISPAGILTVLHNFEFYTDGSLATGN